MVLKSFKYEVMQELLAAAGALCEKASFLGKVLSVQCNAKISNTERY